MPKKLSIIVKTREAISLVTLPRLVDKVCLPEWQADRLWEECRAVRLSSEMGWEELGELDRVGNMEGLVGTEIIVGSSILEADTSSEAGLS